MERRFAASLKSWTVSFCRIGFMGLYKIDIFIQI